MHLWEALSNFDATPLRVNLSPATPVDPPTQLGQTFLRHPNRKLNPAEAVELVADYQAGMPLKKIAAKWGMHEQTVNAHVRRVGVSLRPVRVMTDEQVAEAAQRYVEEGWSVLKLSKHFGRAEATIRTELTNAGVTLRGRGRPRRA